MGINELVETMGWKRFISKLYGFGASIVIVGALFKIQHYPGAGIMLMVGLLTEAVIFFFSAFEPVHPETDWTRVYPELKSDHDGNPVIDAQNGENWAERLGNAKGAKALATAPTTSGSAIQKFDEMLEKAGGNNFFEKLGNNFANFNEKVKDMANVADAAAASKDFSDSLKSAASSVSSFKSTAETLDSTIGGVQSAFSKVSDINFDSIAEGNKAYSKNITELNASLGAINQIFTAQAKDGSLDAMITGVTEASQYAQKYSSEVKKLASNLEALNTIYGNMLTAMNYKA